MLAALNGELVLALALGAFQSQHDLLRCLGLYPNEGMVLDIGIFHATVARDCNVTYLLVEHGLGLTSVTLLLTIVTSLSY